MNDRRFFLQVLGSSAVALGTGCGSQQSTGGGTGAGGAGGGGAGGGATSSTTGTGATSTSSTTGTGATGTSSSTGPGSTSSSTSTSSTTTSTGTGTMTGTDCETNPVGTKLGKPTDYAATGLHIVTNEGTLIGHDAGGYYALTAICTHAGCDMSANNGSGPTGELEGQDITCLCHGSMFNASGTAVHGPASKALRAHPLALGCDGFLYVDKTKFVANTIRLMV